MREDYQILLNFLPVIGTVPVVLERTGLVQAAQACELGRSAASVELDKRFSMGNALTATAQRVQDALKGLGVGGNVMGSPPDWAHLNAPSSDSAP